MQVQTRGANATVEGVNRGLDGRSECMESRNLRVSLRLGKRKILALTAIGLTAVVALAAWRLFGTDGLLAVLIATSMVTPLAIGWLAVRTERRTRLLATQLQQTVTAAQAAQVSRIDGLGGRIEDLEQGAAWQGDQAERLLTAVNARLTRAELTQQQLADVIRQSHGPSHQIADSPRDDTELREPLEE